MPRENCPVCDSPDTQAFLQRTGVPVHQHTLFDSQRAARVIKRGDLEMRACSACGFVYNAAFDPKLVDYGPDYNNAQNCSPAFDEHLDQLAEHVVVERGVSSGRIVEVGCGQGDFLKKVLLHPRSKCHAVGFDPAYTGPKVILGGRARFVADFYGPATAVPADAVTCRHVIEHIPDPVALLRTVRAGIGNSGSTRVFFETPCVEWILRNRVPWDFFYEHCSLFTGGSLALALMRAGFVGTGLRRVFGGQYLWIEGEAGSDPSAYPQLKGEWLDYPFVTEKLDSVVRAFATEERDRVLGWTDMLDHNRARGPVFAWGAGAKGVTFCNLADADGSRLTGVIDVNPAKQGKYLPGTGHPIVSPDAVRDAAAVLVFNPNYIAEVRAMIKRIGARAEIIDPMQEIHQCA